MRNDLGDKIADWLGADDATVSQNERFDEGLTLLGMVMNNLHYIASIKRKGPVAGMKTLRYELGKRAKVKAEAKVKAKAEAKVKEEAKAEENLEVGEVVFEREKGKRFVLREEFPFLANDDCPEEFKILVADMITSHTKYVNGHALLYHTANKSNEECFEAASMVVENYLNNRWIWEELDIYKKTGRILGLHPIFEKRKRMAEIENMDPVELMKLYRNLPRNIASTRQRIKTDTDSEETKKRLEKITQYEQELRLTKRLLGIVDAKKPKASKKKKRAPMKRKVLK